MIPDGAILIRDGVVAEVGQARRLENLAEARKALEINAHGRVVLPGFVDSHTHLLFPASRDGVDASPEEGMVHAIRTTTAKLLQAKAKQHVEAMARHGTTTVGIQTGFSLDDRAERKAVRVLTALQGHPLDIVPAFQLHVPPENLKDMTCGFLPRFRGHAAFADLVWNEEPEYQAAYSLYLETARSLGFSSRIHAVCPSPGGAVAMAVKHRAAGVTHLENATAADISQLWDSGLIVTLLPCESFCSDDPVAPARELIDGGVAVALATNFDPRHTPTLSMQSVITLACKRMRLTAEEAISAATINGAHAAGRASHAGSLEPGKPADLVVLNIGHYEEIGNHFGVNLVHQTMKRGEFIYQEGKVMQESKAPPLLRKPGGELRSA